MKILQQFKCHRCMSDLEVKEVNTTSGIDSVVQDVYISPCEMCSSEPSTANASAIPCLRENQYDEQG